MNKAKDKSLANPVSQDETDLLSERKDLEVAHWQRYNARFIDLHSSGAVLIPFSWYEGILAVNSDVMTFR